MFRIGELVVVKATKRIGIVNEEEKDGVIGVYCQETGFLSVSPPQIVKQSIYECAQKLKHYRNELKSAMDSGKSSDLVEYFAEKVKKYYLLYLKEEKKGWYK